MSTAAQQTAHALSGLVDIAVNLTSERFAADREAIIERALAAGVGQMLITGTSLAESQLAERLTRELCPNHPGVLFSTAGVHPHDAKGVSSSDSDWLSELSGLAANPTVVAIGECGLDFNRDFSPRPVQEKVFEQQLQLAAELGMPVLMHCREAHDRFAAIVRDFRDHLPGGVLHCFTGSRAELYQSLDLDLHIGITGWVCDERRGQELQQLVPDIPASRLLLETDAPWLTPRDVKPKPKKGRNEPALLAHICHTVAALRGVNPAELARQTGENSRRLFELAEG